MPRRHVVDDSNQIVDLATAPQVLVNGVARVDTDAESVTVAFWVHRTTMLKGELQRSKEVELNLVIPRSAIRRVLAQIGEILDTEERGSDGVADGTA